MLMLRLEYSERNKPILWPITSPIISCHGIERIRKTGPCFPWYEKECFLKHFCNQWLKSTKCHNYNMAILIIIKWPSKTLSSCPFFCHPIILLHQWRLMYPFAKLVPISIDVAVFVRSHRGIQLNSPVTFHKDSHVRKLISRTRVLITRQETPCLNHQGVGFTCGLVDDNLGINKAKSH